MFCKDCPRIMIDAPVSHTHQCAAERNDARDLVVMVTTGGPARDDRREPDFDVNALH